jgi:16S rRNA (guanine527-N7)-methyltransferase
VSTLPSSLPSSELESRILSRALTANVPVTADQVAQLTAYYQLLERWNQKINLTSLLPAAGGDIDRSIDKLLIEPLTAIGELDDLGDTSAENAVNWVDFGTGGGSPALPLKILRPRLSLTMVEVRERKTAFLREAVSTLGLPDARVLTVKIEAVSDGRLRGVVDVITARAVKFNADITASAAALLKPGGRLLIFGNDISLVFNELQFKKLRELDLGPGRGTLAVFSNVGCRQ